MTSTKRTRQRSRPTPSRSSAFGRAMRLTRGVLAWKVFEDPSMSGPLAEVTTELRSLPTPEQVRVAAQLLTIIRALAYEIPAERRAMVLDELEALR